MVLFILSLFGQVGYALFSNIDQNIEIDSIWNERSSEIDICKDYLLRTWPQISWYTPYYVLHLREILYRREYFYFILNHLVQSSTMLLSVRHMFSTTRTYLIQTTLNDQPVIPRVSSPVINATIITQWVIYICPCSNETNTGTPTVSSVIQIV